MSTSGSRRGEPVLEPDGPRVSPGLPRQPGLEHAGHLLERAVLEQPGEQQVARLEQREVLLVLDVALREEPRGLEVEQGSGDQEERRRLVEVPLPAPPSVSRDAAPALTWAMNSSVTCESETSVMSSLCFEIRLSSRSKGPSKLSSRSSNDASVPASQGSRT